MTPWRTVFATVIVVLWLGVVLYSLSQPAVAGLVAPMTPVVTLAATYLFGRDAVELMLERRKEMKRDGP